MELSRLETGTKLELELLDDAGERIEPVLVSEFEWYEDNNEAIIAAPIHGGNIYPLHIGARLFAYFLKSRGKEINLYRFEAVVKGREKHDNLHFIKVEMIGDIEKVQRRRFFRLECSLPVKYRLRVSPENDKNNKAPFLETIACNLSGGGIGLLLEEKLEAGSYIECRIFNDIGTEISFIGQIIRCVKNEIESKFKYRAGIAFVKIDYKDREAIVRYIFKQQRKLLKKGLI